MDFSWVALLGTFFAAVIFVVIKNFFEKEKKGKLFSINMIVEIVILTVLFQIVNWIFT